MLALALATAAAMLGVSPALAATLKADYRFEGGLTDSTGQAGALTEIGGPGTFESANVNGNSQTVYRFAKNAGLSFASAGAAAITANSYSIAVLFQFDETSGYRRIADFKNRTADSGFYNLSKKLNFFNPTYTGGADAINSGEFAQAVLTRSSDGTTAGYVNGVPQFSFLDSAGSSEISAESFIHFFADNTSGSATGESSAGQVARIRVYDGALAPAEVEKLGGALTGHVYAAPGGAANALASAPVQACRTATNACRFTTTDGTGSYRFEGLPAGDYRITAFPPASSSALPRSRTPDSVVVDKAETTGQDVVLSLPAPPPSSIKLTGSGVRPTTANGVPVIHWQQPVTMRYYVPNIDDYDPPAVTLTPSTGGAPRPLTPSAPVPDPDNPECPGPNDPRCGYFPIPIPPLIPDSGPGTVNVKPKPKPAVTNPDGEFDFPIYIDPSGFVRTSTGALLPGATVTLYRSDAGTGPFTVVPDGSSIMSPMNRKNPDLTDTGGHFGWDVVTGYYKVRAQKAGCHAPGSPTKAFVETSVMLIPPPVTNLDIRLQCPANAGVATPTPPALAAAPSPAKPKCQGKTATIVGSSGSDSVTGTKGNDVIVTLGGNDKVRAGRGKDIVCTGAGRDNVSGGSGSDRISGGSSNDKLAGDAGDDRLAGEAGNDSLSGGTGKDRINGGAGRDSLSGGAGRDRLSGGSGRDRCKGGAAADGASGCERRSQI